MAIKCLDETVKVGLVDILQELGASKKLIDGVEEMPSCTKGMIEFDKGKKERKRSAYQDFVSQCMTGGKTTLKECAQQWNAKKL